MQKVNGNKNASFFKGAFYMQPINFFIQERVENMSRLIEKLTKLIDVKSIMTLTLTSAFVALVVKGMIDGDKFMSIYTMIVGFYFGVQATKEK